MHSVVETSAYLRSAAALGLSEEERLAIVNTIAADPSVGNLVPRTGGARKLRIARPGSGKSGGYRVITFYCAVDVPVFLLDIYGKNEKVNLSGAERNELRTLLSSLAQAWRDGARVRAAVMRRRKT